MSCLAKASKLLHPHTHSVVARQPRPSDMLLTEIVSAVLPRAAFLSLHVHEFTLGWRLGPDQVEPGQKEGERLSDTKMGSEKDEENEFRGRRGPHKGKHLQTGRELCKWVSH